MKVTTITTKFGAVAGLGTSETIVLPNKNGYANIASLFSDWKTNWLYLLIPVVAAIAAAKIFNVGHTLYKRTEMKQVAMSR